MTQALEVEPDNKTILQELAILKRKSAKDAHHEKNLYKKMLGTANKSLNETKKSDKKIAPTKLTWSLLGGTVAAVVGIIAYRFMS